MIRILRGAPAALTLVIAGLLPASGRAEGLRPGAYLLQQSVERSADGWVGLRVDFIASSATQAQQGHYTVVITGVDPGSPAGEAGIQPGDTLVMINGAEASPTSFQALRASMRAGDEIRLAVRRETEDREISVVAGSRPFLLLGQSPGQMVVRIDSLRSVILRNADSLRGVTDGRPLARDHGEFRIQADSFITVLDVSEGSPMRGAQGTVRVRSADGSGQGQSWVFRYESPETPMPFEMRIVQSPRADSLQRAIVSLRRELEIVQRTERQMEAELARISETQASQGAVNGQLQRIEAIRLGLTAELEASQAALSELSLQEFEERQTPPTAPRTIRATAPTADVPPSIPPTAITPYVVGRTYLAGAEVATLNEGLAVYFEVAEGVLVTEVARRSPADEAGLRPGDVIVAIDDRAVRTVDELRDRLAQRWDGAVLSVVRHGDHRELVLTR